MNVALPLGILAISISVLALVISSFLGVRQLRLMRDANHVQVLVQFLSKFRSKRMYDDYEYVTKKLRSEHGSELGISGLPDPAKAAVLNMAYYYQLFALFVDLGIVDDKLLFVLRPRIIDTWDAIAPYVAVERRASPLRILTILEELAERARNTPVCPRRLHFRGKYAYLQALRAEELHRTEHDRLRSGMSQ